MVRDIPFQTFYKGGVVGKNYMNTKLRTIKTPDNELNSKY